MTTKTTTALQRRSKGIHPKKPPVQQKLREKCCTLPEYLEAHEVQAVLAAAPHAPARLLMLLQWRARLRVSEAVALEASDLSLDTGHPTIRVRQSKGGRSLIVPVHPELLNALSSDSSSWEWDVVLSLELTGLRLGGGSRRRLGGRWSWAL